MSGSVLIVDDDAHVRTTLARMVASRGFVVETAASATAALQSLDAHTPDVILTDLAMPEMSGIALLEKLRHAESDIPVVLMSGAGTVSDAVRALQLGAVDFLEKPVRLERLVAVLESCVRLERLSRANDELRRETREVDLLLGESAPMRELKALVQQVAPTLARVLILGENGTGKELVAAAIHAASPRSTGPFVKLNCSAVPRDLVESELFGHEKGAFTGASATRKGRFELADHGTLFLDEVGDTSIEMQAKLLRVLQEGTFERVGGSRTISVDVRVIAATNKDLLGMIGRGEFREDLYYRLAVVTLTTPPLRERREDIPRLARAFLERALDRHGRSRLRFADDALAALSKHDFPGNVRELHNIVERLAILATSDAIDAKLVERALPFRAETRKTGTVVAAPSLFRPGARLVELVDELEKRVVMEALDAHGGNKSATARALGLDRSNFHKKLRALGLDDESS